MYRQEAVCTIFFGLYNNHNIHNGGLESALSGMSQANINLGFFQEKKVVRGIDARELGVYWVAATEATSLHRSVVDIFYRYS